MRLGDGECLVLADCAFKCITRPVTPRDSRAVAVEDRVFTGDHAAHRATGRTDLPSGRPEPCTTPFNKVLRLDPRSSFSGA